MDILNNCFKQQKECYALNPYSSYAQRIKVLQLLRKIIKDNQAEIIAAINQDFGCRSDYETKVLEIFPSLQAIDYAINNLKSWMKMRAFRTSIWFKPSKCYLLPQPKGVVGIIAPWNYPLFLVIAPLVSALAAGNRVMIKLSEYVPTTALLLKNFFAKIFVDSKVAVFLGGVDVATKFCELPFDHLLFTGSTENGKKVMAAAAANLTPLTLELGGKSPAILLNGEIKYEYIEKILFGKVVNSGQTCIAPDYLWFPKGNLDKLLILFQSVWNIKYKNNTDCSIINKKHYDRLIYLVEEAISQGAKWVPFRKLIGGSWHGSHNNIYHISPGLLLDVNHKMAIMQEEIFGPILPVMEYDSLKQLLNIIQAIPRSLVIYLFTEDKNNQKLFATKTISGALSFNSTIVYAAQEQLPFGGIGQSGLGYYRGIYGFETFSLLKPIYRQSKLDFFSKFYPPIKTWQKKLLDYLIR